MRVVSRVAAGAAGAAAVGAAAYTATAPSASVLSLRTPSPARAFASGGEQVYDLSYYLKAGIAGAICCGVTHGLMTPVDVVKTRIQLDPVKYNKGMIGGFKQVIEAEGAGALLTGLGATVAGYHVQGFFKFGGVEVIKIKLAHSMTPQEAWNNRTGIYIAAAAGAEFVADLFLCPLEAVRIRSVSDKTFPQSLPAGAVRMLQTDGILGFYAGLGPILFKQVPYTVAKFLVQGLVADATYASMGKTPKDVAHSTNLTISLASGVIAGVASAVISHPADTLLSKINKAGAGGTGSTTQRLVRIAKELGFVKLATVGLGARCVMIGTLTGLQFLIFDTVLKAVGASRYHFHDPSTDKH